MISLQKYSKNSLILSLLLTGCASATRVAQNTSKNQTESTKIAQDSTAPEAPYLGLEEFYQDDTFEDGLLLDDDSDLDASSGPVDESLADDSESSQDDRDFCRDDVYAKHLIRKYNETKTPAEKITPKNKTKKTKKSRHRFKSDGDYTAQSFARDRMNGPISPYFGSIPVVVNNRVDYWVQYYKTIGRKEFLKWLIRGEGLKDKVKPILHDGGVPIEFYYLAMVESGFNTGAKSRARATGTWQFMRGTAQLYGLKVNHWVDERLDPVKSTIAAANYLRDLYAELGDWYLAMAAYNAGPGKIRSAIRRSGSRDFWRLAETKHIARETANYVPKVLAAILLASDPKGHGFDFRVDHVEPFPDAEVLVTKPVQLDEIASKLGISRRQLALWNPELIRNITPPSRKGYKLRLTTGLAEKWESVQNQIAAVEITDVQTHTIRKGETLSRLARLYKVRIRDIQAVNPDLSANRLRPGKTVAIPVPGITQRQAGLRVH